MGPFQNNEWRHRPSPSRNGLHRRNVTTIIRIHEAKRLALIQCNDTVSDSATNSEARLVRIPDLFNLDPFSAILRRIAWYASRILSTSCAFTSLALLIRDLKIRLTERDEKDGNGARRPKSRRRSEPIT